MTQQVAGSLIAPADDSAVGDFTANEPGTLVTFRRNGSILPESILSRGKMGFGAPLGSWFRSDLGELVRERLLDPSSPLFEYLEPAPVTTLVQAHMTASADLSAQIWALLTLESWLRQEAQW